MRNKPAIVILNSLMLTGCMSMVDKYDGNEQWSQAGSQEVSSPEGWVGASKEQLVAALGAPPRAIHSRGPQGQATWNYIYGKGDNSKDCIETYLIEKSSGMVLEYTCY